MALALVGGTFVFQATFVDATNTPVAAAPTIEVFQFNSSGNKTVHVAALTAMTAVPGDTGRYIYVFTLPATLARGDTLYGYMIGTDPGPLTPLIAQQEVGLLSSADAGGGLTAAFVKDGDC